MQKLQAVLVFSTLLFVNLISAQQPAKTDAVAIFHQIQKLNFLGSVLYIAAHPDDENTRLISYLSTLMTIFIIIHIFNNLSLFKTLTKFFHNFS